MTPPFSAAAASPVVTTGNRLVFTSDWQDTLVRVGGTNFALLEFLSDAARAGHKVILTSTLHMYKVEELFKLTIELGRMRGFDIAEMADFTMISKADLQALSADNLIDIDYAFDDEPIASQAIPYGTPAVELRVHRDFSTAPFSLDTLRELCNLPRKTAPAGHSGPQPATP